MEELGTIRGFPLQACLLVDLELFAVPLPHKPRPSPSAGERDEEAEEDENVTLLPRDIQWAVSQEQRRGKSKEQAVTPEEATTNSEQSTRGERLWRCSAGGSPNTKRHDARGQERAC